MGLLTGAYQQRFGCYWNDDLWAKHGLNLPEAQKLMPQALAAAGYLDGPRGKVEHYARPATHVDEAFAVMIWKGAYYPNEEGVYLGVDGPDFQVESHGWGPPRPGAEYLTDRLNPHAVDFLDHPRRRTLLSLSRLHAPHTPLQADKKYEARFRPYPARAQSTPMPRWCLRSTKTSSLLDKLRERRAGEEHGLFRDGERQRPGPGLG